MKTARAGRVMEDPTRNKAPGKVSIVATYTFVYNGTYSSGVMFSANANIEFIFPEIINIIVLISFLLEVLKNKNRISA